ncbi:venom carboxylesterase-6-like [Contarinia nasturtii]|uniref:venom carboxylesterase-6-like n=1 Tax=Contarinia nasturtii TaxID=265458 RepID=UPI0012D3D1D1|nr:venom carboxylesterase-6-like [Contarinia nasturtii]
MVRFFLMLLTVWQIFLAILSCDEFLIVSTKSGFIKGVTQKTFLKHHKYLSYIGIPYAEAPIGELRYKVPVPISPWNEMLETTYEYRDVCPVLAQSNFFPLNSTQSENCLFVNIFTPVLGRKKKAAKLPVMFFIHGGAFTEGDSTNGFYGPDMFIEQNIVLVTFDYRLGPFGFCNFNLPGLTGNMGFKDQQVALEWIYNNIKYFGGNPHKITVFGESAGGISTHLQVLNSQSRKFIDRAISMSCTAFNYFAHYDDQLNLLYDTFEDELNGERNKYALYDFMKTAPTELIIQKTPAFKVDDSLLILYWGFNIEDKRIAEKPFLTKTIRKIYETTNINVEMLFGKTSAEALSLIRGLTQNDLYGWVDPMNQNFNVRVPFHGLTLSQTTRKWRDVQRKIRKFYFGTGTIKKTSYYLNRYVQMLSDINFVFGIYKAIEVHLKHAKTSCYEFNLNLRLNFAKITENLKIIDGMGLYEEIAYLFRANKYAELYDEVLSNPSCPRNQKTLEAFNFAPRLFANYAKTGSGFGPVERDNIECVKINNDDLKQTNFPKIDAMELWSNIYEELKPWIVDDF